MKTMTKKDMELANLRQRVEDQRRELEKLNARCQIQKEQLARKDEEIARLKEMLDAQIRQNQFLSGRL